MGGPCDEAYAYCRHAEPLPAETVLLEHAHGRSTAGSIVADVHLPRFENPVPIGFTVGTITAAGASAAAPISLRITHTNPKGPLDFLGALGAGCRLNV
jgi:molybdopterin biosynthesis enzyme